MKRDEKGEVSKRKNREWGKEGRGGSFFFAVVCACYLVVVFFLCCFFFSVYTS